MERTEFDADAKRLDLYLDFRMGGHLTCAEWGAKGCPAQDTSEKTWRHLNFFQHEAYLHGRVPKARCESCGVKLVDVPWARTGSGFTLLFEAMVLAMIRDMPVAAVARLVGGLTRGCGGWAITTSTSRGRRSATPRSIESEWKTSLRRGHNYLTMLVDLGEPRALFATEGREAETFALFRDDFEAHGGDPDRIRELCMDMSPAYRKGARQHLPNARTTFDRFHVVKPLNEAVDQVRRAERKEAPELKRTRYLWLKMAFQDFWELPPVPAGRFLDAWCVWARDSDLPPLQRFADTVRRHRRGILRWFHTRISNGLLEGLSSLVQAAKANARGYRSTKNLTAMIYLMHGKLPLFKPT